jgi:hypothetical protein
VAGDQVIPKLTEIFQTFGFPRLIRSDNGAPFNGHVWAEFAQNRDIIHEPVTPYHQQANGVVEAFMKIAQSRLVTDPNFADSIR